MDREDWRELAAKELKGADPVTLNWATPEGIEVQPLYTGDDLEGIADLDSLPDHPQLSGRSPLQPGRRRDPGG